MEKENQLDGEVSRGFVVVSRGAYDKEKGVLRDISFASETPCESWYGMEILSCKPEDVDISRITSGAVPFTMDHSGEVEDQLGLVQSVRFEGGTMRADILLSDREEIAGVLRDIERGIARNISVEGKKIKALSDVTQDGIRTIRWSWMPTAISLVGIPADTNVGIGRSAGGMEKHTENKNMSENKTGEVPAVPKEQEKIDVQVIRSEAGNTARKEAAELMKVARMHKAEDLGEKALAEGWDNARFQRELLDVLSKRAPVQGAANLGLTKDEAKSYSIMNVIRALSGDRKVDIGFEREVSDEAAKRQGRSAQGLIIPHDVLVVKRDLQIGGGGSGSAVVSTNVMGGSFIDALRNRLIGGVNMMSGLVGDVAIPKLTGASTAYWVTEGNAPTESQQTLAQVTGTPHTVGAFTDITRKLLKQSSVDAEALVRDDLTQVLAIAINSAIINGSGAAGQPSGLLLASGINNPSISSAGSATYAEILGFLADIETDNAAIGDMAWYMTPEVYANLAARPRGTGDGFILDASNKTCIGIGAEMSNQLPANTAILGVWNQIVLGMWGGLDITVDPYSNSTSGTLRVVALQDVDVMIRHAQAFAYNSAVTA